MSDNRTIKQRLADVQKMKYGKHPKGNPVVVYSKDTDISPEEIASKLNTLPGGLSASTIRDLPNVTAQDVVAELKSLKGNDRIDISHIRNGEQLSRISQRIDMNDQRWRGGGVEVFDSIGNKVSSGSGLQFVGATVTNTDGRTTTVTITGGGSGVTVVTPTGTVNGSNTVFTVATQPKWVIVDSSIYFETLHYTYSGVTLTMDALIAPTEFIRAIL